MRRLKRRGFRDHSYSFVRIRRFPGDTDERANERVVALIGNHVAIRMQPRNPTSTFDTVQIELSCRARRKRRT